MRYLTKPSFLLILLITITLGYENECEAACVIRGTVTSESTGVPGVRVQVGHESALTNDDGRFEIKNLTSGTHRIRLSHPLYVLEDTATKDREGLQIVCSESEEKSLDLVVSKGGILFGKIIDTRGDAVIGQIVRLKPQAKGNRLVESKNIYTNDLGEFRFFGLNPGEYTIHFSPSEYGDTSSFQELYYPGNPDEPNAKYISLLSGEERDIGSISLKYRNQGFTIKGTFLTSSDKQPVPNYFFTLRGIDNSKKEVEYPGSSDNTGGFFIDSLSEGVYSINPDITKNKLPYNFKPITLKLSSDISGISIHLEPGISLVGNIRLPDGKRFNLANFQVALKEGKDFLHPNNPVYKTHVLADGNFSFQGLRPTEYLVLINCVERGIKYRSLFIVDGIQSEHFAKVNLGKGPGRVLIQILETE